MKYKPSIDMSAAGRIEAYLSSDVNQVDFTDRRTQLLGDHIMQSVCSYMAPEEVDQLIGIVHCLMAYAAQDGFAEGLAAGMAPLDALTGKQTVEGGEGVGDQTHSG